MALNAGLRAWHARRRKERHKAAARVDAQLDAAGIDAAERPAVRNAYRDYLLGRDRTNWGPIGERSGPVMPSGVTEGPSVDWSGYDALASYS